MCHKTETTCESDSLKRFLRAVGHYHDFLCKNKEACKVNIECNFKQYSKKMNRVCKQQIGYCTLNSQCISNIYVLGFASKPKIYSI